MAFRNVLTQRLLNITKISSQTFTNCCISSSPVQARRKTSASKPHIEIEPGDHYNFWRLLHKQAVFQPEHRPSSFGESFMEKLKVIDIVRNRIRLDGSNPPAEKSEVMGEMTVEDARKLLKVAQMELVKTKLKEIRKGCISYSEFIRICEENCLDTDQATRIAKMLDDSAAVIILGNVVYLRPEQVAKAIQDLIPIYGAKPHDRRRKEFEEMEKQKAAIDKEADTLVRRELWGGLSFLVLQTAAFMRLTFWELSWDVMEPICFFVTSTYFIAGYTFFLRTSKEPCFEGFYQHRFSAKQKRLMKLHNFDFAKYNELREACSPYHPLSSEADSTIGLPFNDSFRYH